MKDLKKKPMEKEIPGKGENKSTGIHSRRKFIGGAASAAIALNIVPRHVLGGAGFVPPSDKITLAYIGCGTQGLRELLPILAIPEVQIIAVCDPQKEAIAYYDWGKYSLRDNIRKTLQKPDWTSGGDNTVPGGRDVGKDVVDTYYSKFRADQKIKGCNSYADFRELFEKEKDLNAIKVMTPDHLHGIIAMAAIKRGISITMHKPIANRLEEGRKVIEMAGKSKVTTHLIPWDINGSMEQVMNWINEGAIGTLKAVHDFSNRPVWPQYPVIPTDTPPVPRGMDWDLWLGPEADRPYHPHYTNMVFRGWYDFGGGSMADMGYYSLWTIFKALQLENPTIIEPNLSHACAIRDSVSNAIKNDYSFPLACSVRFKYPAKGSRPAIDLVWYDGGMKPPVPDAMYAENKEMPNEAMMFEGDRGYILAGWHVENPHIYPSKMMEGRTVQERQRDKVSGFQKFINAVKEGKQCPGAFTDAWPITEAANLYAVALRAGKTLKYDATNRKFTNAPEADKYLSRNYRKGWEPENI